MRTLLLANNNLGIRIGRYLLERNDLVGVVTHPEGRQKHGRELATLTRSTWVWPAGLDEATALEPDCLLSVLFGYRIPVGWLRLPRWRALNLHPGLLPFNAGANPNVWPLVDGSPAGTTLHVMTEGIDEGPVLAQRVVPTHPDDTAYSLYGRLEDASFDLFRDVWPEVTSLELTPQPSGGSSHRTADLRTLDLTPADFGVLDRIRARTFPPFGIEFERDGVRYRARIEIEAIHPDSE